MAKYKYIEYNPHGATKDLIAVMNSIIQQMQAQGYMLSVRQLYYQLVTLNYIQNKEQSYKRVVDVLNNARLGGLVDWDAIEDRNRDVVKRASWLSGGSILRACAGQYHMDMWDNQPDRVFVIVEKAALAGVLERVCVRHDVPLLAARGYPSVSITRELVVNYLRPATRAGQHVTVLHLGDHDPSGIDMTRDLEDRIDMFMEGYAGVTLKRIALNMRQIEEEDPPPNPAKTTDSRFEGYMKKFGRESWELDALRPAYLAKLVEDEVANRVDPHKWAERQAEIDYIKERLQRTADEFDNPPEPDDTFRQWPPVQPF